MNAGNIAALREMLIRIESAATSLSEAANIANRTNYSEFAHGARQRAAAIEHLRAQVERRLFELERLEVEFGLTEQ